MTGSTLPSPLLDPNAAPAASALLQASQFGHGVRVDTVRAAPAGELLDGLLVTTLVDDTGTRFTRVAVFDPAENTTVPDHRGLAHHAVAVAAKHFASAAHPLTAVARAAAELHDPARHGMRNPLTTCVWVDVTTSSGRLVLRSAGRCGDGEVLVADGRLTAACTTPMWRPDAGAAWLRWCAEHAPHIDRLWFERERQIADRGDYLCPHLGQFYPAAPDVADLTVLPAAEAIVVATDGALLEELAGGELAALPGHLSDVLHRPSTWSHPDIALAVLTAA